MSVDEYGRKGRGELVEEHRAMRKAIVEFEQRMNGRFEMYQRNAEMHDELGTILARDEALFRMEVTRVFMFDVTNIFGKLVIGTEDGPKTIL